MHILRHILVYSLLFPAGLTASPLYLGKNALCETETPSRPDPNIYQASYKKAFPVLLEEARASTKSRIDSINCYRDLNLGKKEINRLMKNHLLRVDYALEIFSRKLRTDLNGYQTQKMKNKTEDFIKTKYILYGRLHDKSLKLLTSNKTKTDDREDLLNIYLALRRLHYDYYSSFSQEDRRKLTVI